LLQIGIFVLPLLLGQAWNELKSAQDHSVQHHHRQISPSHSPGLPPGNPPRITPVHNPSQRIGDASHGGGSGAVKQKLLRYVSQKWNVEINAIISGIS
jgi:hypothetical protein